MDSIKLELTSVLIIYIGLGLLASVTQQWWLFIILALNITIIYVIVYAKCQDMDFVKKLGEKILIILMKKYGGLEISKIFLEKKKVENNVD